MYWIVYKCPNPDCSHGWREQYDCPCDSECPNCETKNIEAFAYQKIIYVHVLRISHRYGDNIEAHANEESALASLYEYVSQEWNEAITEQYGSLANLTREKAIDAYFDCHDFAVDPEFYEIKVLEVLA